MKRYVVDTQCLVWFLAGDRRLPRSVKTVFTSRKRGAGQILVPSICTGGGHCFSCNDSVLPEDVVRELMTLPDDKRFSIACRPPGYGGGDSDARLWPGRRAELADRIIAATARVHDLPLLTVDHAIAESGLVRVIN